ncbi:hypothetical protein BSFA1_86140 (plasmid) [Burkholderia sp. SFA1]|nr:hypothetical protein BSFA1_86140 [Burkholderia sp. SFA1]
MPLSQLKPKSDSAVVRNMLAEIEAALNFGASRESIWKMLCQEQGLKLTFDGFVKALWRARRVRPQPTTKPGHRREADTGALDSIGRSGNRPDTIEPDRNASIESQEVAAKRNRIRTTQDFESVHSMDFSEFDDKFK